MSFFPEDLNPFESSGQQFTAPPYHCLPPLRFPSAPFGPLLRHVPSPLTRVGVQHVIPQDGLLIFALLQLVLGHVACNALEELGIVLVQIVVLSVLDPAGAETAVRGVANLMEGGRWEGVSG